MIDFLFGRNETRLRRRFSAAAKSAPPGPLRAYYDAGLPLFDAPVEELHAVALDLETDGLDFGASAILEAGLVEMSLAGLHTDTAVRLRLRPRAALSPSSVIIHRITDDALADAMDEPDALALLLARLAGKPVVAHFAEIEAGFLNAACKRVYGAPFVAPFICTMQLETRWFPRDRAADGLRLAKLRSGYRLPPYRAHDGLTDALACGELLLAQIAHRDAEGLTLASLLRR